MQSGGLTQSRMMAMRPDHVESVVSLHLESFRGFFLTFLGRRFLRLLYTEIVREPSHVGVIATDGAGVPVGFAVGVVEQAGFYRRLARRRPWAFAFASLGALVRRPAIAPRLFRALFHHRRAMETASPAVLMSLAVHPSTAGQGVGSDLVRCFLREMQARGVKAVSLTTDRENNDVVNRFYQRAGFQLARSYTTPEKRAMNEYVIELNRAA